MTGAASEGFNTVTLPVEMQDNNYTAFATNISGYAEGTGSSHAYVMAKAGVVNSLTTTSIGVFSQNSGERYSWQVSGYAAESAYASAGMRLEYYYVGNFEQSAIEQTAGITAETLNGKADCNLLNTTDNVDIVVESQMPTANNGYTWYKKYKSGWVEQGGRFSSTATNSFNTITMPVAMRDTNYCVFSSNLTNYQEGVSSSHAYVMEKTASIYNLTTTTIGVFSQNTGRDFVWQVSGMSAQ